MRRSRIHTARFKLFISPVLMLTWMFEGSQGRQPFFPIVDRDT